MALADQADVSKFHVLGHDWGATVAWQLAAAHPGRVLTLAALSVPHPWAFFRSWMRSQIFRSWYMFLFQVPWLGERLIQTLLELPGLAERLFERGDGLAARISRRTRTRALGVTPVDEMLAFWHEPGAATAALNWYRAMWRRRSIPGKVLISTLYVWSTEDPLLGRRSAEMNSRYVQAPYRFENLGGV